MLNFTHTERERGGKNIHNKMSKVEAALHGEAGGWWVVDGDGGDGDGDGGCW